MKIASTLVLLLALTVSFSFAADDENHEIIEKVMKEGMKGDDSPIAKVLDKKASEEESKDLLALVKTLEVTKAPVGEQDAYNEKVAALIVALTTVVEGDSSDAALDKLDEAQSCKACHKDHKPKKE